MNHLEAYMQKMIQATLEKNVLNRQPQLLQQQILQQKLLLMIWENKKMPLPKMSPVKQKLPKRSLK